MLFGCPHKHTTTPRRDEAGEYVRCLRCTARLAWSLDLSDIRPPRKTAGWPHELTGIERQELREMGIEP